MPAFTLWGLEAVDLVAIVLYFAAMIYIGYRAMTHIRSQEDYFLAGRKFGKLIQTFAAFGQATSADSAVAATTMVNTNGAAGIWAGLAGGLVNLPIFWMTSVWYRRMRLLTLADFFEERYGSKAMAAFYAAMQAVFFMLVAGLGFSAMTKTVAAIASKPVAELTAAEKAEYDTALEIEQLEKSDFRGLSEADQNRLKELRRLNPHKEFTYINGKILTIVMAVVVLFYAVAGGLEAAFLTDLVQGCFILVLSVLLLPFAMLKINALHGTSGPLGPFQAMHRLLPESFFELWGSPAVIEFTWYWIAAFALLGVVNVAVQANQLTSCGSARDDYTARYGFVAGILLKRYATVMWGCLALMTLVLYGSTVKDPDFVWGLATRDLLGPLNIGLVGLMIACLMAALMSTVDCLMLTTSALLTRNLYRPLVPNRPDRHYIFVGRVFGAIYIAGGVLIAMYFTSIFNLLKFVSMFNCILAASFWLGMLWRRSNRLAAWTSMIVTFVLTFLLPLIIPFIPGVRTSPYLLKTTESSIVKRVYTARDMDVAERQAAIERWDQAHARGQAKGQRPRPLAVGEKFEKSFPLPEKSIFWVNEFETVGGVKQGSGFLKVELVAVDLLGWDLSKNAYSFNETMAILLRLILPFASLVVVALLTRPEDKARLDRFYVKMKTPTQADHAADARQMELSYANPHRFDRLKLFPRSNWELRRWDRQDIKGILGASLASAGIVLLLYLMVIIGK